MDQPDSNFSGLSATMTLDRLSSPYLDDDVEDESSGDRVDYYANYSCTLDDGNCISEVGFPFHIEQVEEENCEEEDWCLVESCS